MDLVEHQQRIVSVGELPRFGCVLGGHRVDAALALDPFDHDAGGTFRDHLFERGQVIGRDELHARNERLEILAILRLTCDRDRARGPSMKGIIERYDLVLGRIDLASMRADHLDGTLHALRAGVAEKGALQAACLGQPLRQFPLVLVIVKVGRMQQQSRLFTHHSDHARVSITERVDADARDQIEIALPLDVIQITAAAAMHDHGVTGVILKHILALERLDLFAWTDLLRDGGSSGHGLIIITV